MSRSAAPPVRPPRTARQDELVELALELTREVGLAGLTVRRLAERAGFTEAALYRHFHDKQALLLAMIERLSEERLLGPIRTIGADAGRTARQRLVAIVRHHVTTILALEGLPVLVAAEAAAAGDEALLARFRAITGEVRRILVSLIDEARAGRDERPSAGAVALTLFGIGATTALQHRLGRNRDLEREAREELPELLVERLLGPEPKQRTVARRRKR
jgi:AcrR family transcriptional regulator